MGYMEPLLGYTARMLSYMAFMLRYTELDWGYMRPLLSYTRRMLPHVEARRALATQRNSRKLLPGRVQRLSKHTYI